MDRLQNPIPQISVFLYGKRCNTLGISWLTRSMANEVVQSIIFLDLASYICKELKDRFSQGDYVRISQIYSELYSLKQAESSVNFYYTKLRILWDELANFQPIPSASCCAVSKKMYSYRDNNSVVVFLQGLNDNFADARFQILLLDPLPPLSKVFSMVIQHEKQFQGDILSTPVAPTVSTFPAGTNSRPKASRTAFLDHGLHKLILKMLHQTRSLTSNLREYFFPFSASLVFCFSITVYGILLLACCSVSGLCVLLLLFRVCVVALFYVVIFCLFPSEDTVFSKFGGVCVLYHVD